MRWTQSPEERVHQIRAALQCGNRSHAEDQFAELLQVSEGRVVGWLRRTVACTPALHNASVYVVCEELRQELAFHLWEGIADPTRRDMAWERTYWSALTYAQQHVARDYMSQAGYWVVDRTVKQATRGVAVPLLEDNLMSAAEAPDVLLTAELAADMRALVMRLPPKERDAVVLRYWQDMREQDIAVLLGCTDRNVRILLRKAHQQLATWYEGQGCEVSGCSEKQASARVTLQAVGGRGLE